MWKTIQQINFTGNLERARNKSILFILQVVKETASPVNLFVLIYHYNKKSSKNQLSIGRLPEPLPKTSLPLMKNVPK